MQTKVNRHRVWGIRYSHKSVVFNYSSTALQFHRLFCCSAVEGRTWIDNYVHTKQWVWLLVHTPIWVFVQKNRPRVGTMSSLFCLLYQQNASIKIHGWNYWRLHLEHIAVFIALRLPTIEIRWLNNSTRRMICCVLPLLLGHRMAKRVENSPVMQKLH